MRKLYEIFKVLKVTKKIVSAETICGNRVSCMNMPASPQLFQFPQLRAHYLGYYY